MIIELVFALFFVAFLFLFGRLGHCEREPRGRRKAKRGPPLFVPCWGGLGTAQGNLEDDARKKGPLFFPFYYFVLLFSLFFESISRLSTNRRNPISKWTSDSESPGKMMHNAVFIYFLDHNPTDFRAGISCSVFTLSENQIS